MYKLLASGNPYAEITEEELAFELITIEHTLDRVDPDEGFERLKLLDLSKGHPLMSNVLYLKGKYHSKNKNWEQALICFNKAIEIEKSYSAPRSNNISSICYQELGRIAMYENDLRTALQYTQKGLNSFVEGGERKYCLYFLLVSKVIYLRNLNRVEEALVTLNELNSQRENIESTSVLLNMADMQADLLNRTERYEEATHFALKGIELARIESNFERLFDLWTVLGASYMSLKKWTQAERCFLEALKLKDNIKREYLAVTTYKQIGELYTILDKKDEALDNLKKAVKLGKETNDALRTCEALISLGDFHAKYEDFKKAKTKYNQALLLAEKHAFSSQEDVLVIKMVACSTTLGSDIAMFSDRLISIVQRLTGRSDSDMFALSSQIMSTKGYVADPPET
ncbi:tetratricopeptide (TPR) repeat protein [Croceifilum oryzae]|uniref:Tetratricopeptide (TPR) repeat protein n=1 Tax=Croceifilum oryzae TaxID=1553429 RepID=A0AAJ1TCZ1_9BACL|nr:tetratricopeptide repeat protein [Croceifilum oryzae]MDQ0416615.1 tetratricopeptide (TPR) repeat protein [Croceifilum oryzae]